MPILPPRVLGPLSECSRSVIYENALPGATVILLRTRTGATQPVGRADVTHSRGVVALDPGEEFAGGDLVSARHTLGAETSDPQSVIIEVQRSDNTFHPPQVLTHLYACSRGFSLGAMRPGTIVDVLDGVEVIARGTATDGTAFARVVHEFGLPITPGTVLTSRQRVCPKPPPPGNAPEWVVDYALPPVEALPTPVAPGGLLPAPTIVAGLTACSRAVQVAGIIPGAEVFIEEPGAWWASLDPSDHTSYTIALPVALREGHEVEVRQEIGRRCEMQPERRRQQVAPQAQLVKPFLGQIDCSATPSLFAANLKQDADIEFEVTVQGQTTVWRTIATNPDGPLPAPPMADGAVVRIRQGECEVWSEWSDPKSPLGFGPVHTPLITGNLFACQNVVPVRDLWPLAGTVRVVSDVLGPLKELPVSSDIMHIPVAPALHEGHRITVVHDACGMVMTSEPKQVLPLPAPSGGEVVGPLYDGDTQVTVKDVTAGATIELWDQNGRLQSGQAPSSDDPGGTVTVTFSGLNPLRAGQHIYLKFWHCGHYGRNEGLPVVFRRPELTELIPSSVIAGRGVLTITARGQHFRPGAMINFTGAGSVTTTFVSTTELRADIAAHHVVSAGDRTVLVFNPDGVASGTLTFRVLPEPPPPPPTPPTISVAYEGPSSAAKFTVTGSGFTPNHSVAIRGVRPDTFEWGRWTTTSTASGTIQFVISGPALLGLQLAFSATDGRTVPPSVDITGFLWSNTVTVTVT